MNTALRVLIPIVLFVLITVATLRLWTAFRQQAGHLRPTPESHLGANEHPPVVSGRPAQTHPVPAGTHVMAPANMSNPLMRDFDHVDGMAFSSHLETFAGHPKLSTQALATIARQGIRLLVVGKDGNLPLPATGAGGGPPTLDISTDQLLKLRSGLGLTPLEKNAILSLRSKLEWNDRKEAYDLRGIELGLPGTQRFRLIYEQDDDGNDVGGLRFKTPW